MKKQSKRSGSYRASLERFTEKEECAPFEAVITNPITQHIAKRFNKTPEEVAHDINRIYLDSYRPLRSRALNLLDDIED
jgi:hypothetical protein